MVEDVALLEQADVAALKRFHVAQDLADQGRVGDHVNLVAKASEWQKCC